MAERQVRFGIKVAQMTGLYNEGMRDAWLEADRLGFDTGWGHDHLLNQNDYTSPEEEGWTILAALLALSKQIRGGLLVTANTFRHPAVLAKMATTIDRISNGRLDRRDGRWLDGGRAQPVRDGPAVASRDRLRMLDEACQVMIALWTQEQANFEGEHYQLREALHEPKPIQQPHPPIAHRRQRREGHACGSPRSTRPSGTSQAARPRRSSTSARCWTSTARRWGATRARSSARRSSGPARQPPS